ncbi:hypothetical protein D3C71_2050730 [compost metagenome]
MGEQRARRIELASADAITVAVRHKPRLDIARMAGVPFRPGIAQPAPGQHAFVVVALLRGRSGQPQQVQESEMVLRDLA